LAISSGSPICPGGILAVKAFVSSSK